MSGTSAITGRIDVLHHGPQRTAPRDGVVAEGLVAAGDQVVDGAQLLVTERESD
jgi:hypothetical protein